MDVRVEGFAARTLNARTGLTVLSALARDDDVNIA
jgi:hypothetical protein